MELVDGLSVKKEDLTELHVAAVKEMLKTNSCFDEDVRRREGERLEWIECNIPALPPLGQEEKEEEEGCDDEHESDESDESGYDEDC